MKYSRELFHPYFGMFMSTLCTHIYDLAAI